MEVHPPTEAEVAEVATQIYQANVLGSNLAVKAEESVLRAENLCKRITTTMHSVRGKREYQQRLDVVEMRLQNHNVVTGCGGGSETDRLTSLKIQLEEDARIISRLQEVLQTDRTFSASILGAVRGYNQYADSYYGMGREKARYEMIEACRLDQSPYKSREGASLSVEI
ncbi:hypothetical protein BDM02DRAFT_3131938 [Thelephora ganbajun]|uniref:Uncharacterized protein n=1 Tax=Thelephora ganbajun TaxID=370292 RepID=A0ACB6Z3R9_THEGA|nr:hypothetical protein BDM02DRAFT_3131938 [Thelephora ganbajun]